MKRTAICLSMLLGAAGWVAQAMAADDLKIVTEHDVVYTKAGETELKLDVAKPAEGDGPFPGVLVIHGGGWRGGNKADVRPILDEFAKRGYVAISPQYRFCPKDHFPAQVHDVKAAVRWLKAHAKDYKVDAGHIGAIGFSAGAHLSMMLGVTSASDGLEGEAAADDLDLGRLARVRSRLARVRSRLTSTRRHPAPCLRGEAPVRELYPADAHTHRQRVAGRRVPISGRAAAWRRASRPAWGPLRSRS